MPKGRYYHTGVNTSIIETGKYHCYGINNINN